MRGCSKGLIDDIVIATDSLPTHKAPCSKTLSFYEYSSLSVGRLALSLDSCARLALPSWDTAPS